MKLPNTNTVFHQDFYGPVSVAKAGGTLVGSPTFVGGGVSFDGSSDYIQYSVPSTLLAHKKISFVVEFIPEFDWDINAHSYLYTTETPSSRILKGNNASNNILVVDMAGSAIASISSATYSPYWLVNKRNVLVISSESGSTNAWLNGSQILTNDSSTWTPVYNSSLYIGASKDSDSFFDGTIKSFSIHNRNFTQEDVSALQNNSLYNFYNKSDVWLDFKSQTTGRATSELLSDGDAEDVGVAAWTSATGALTKQTDNPYEGSQYLKSTENGAGFTVHYQATTTDGEEYYASGVARGDGVSQPYIATDDAGVILWTGEVSTDWQPFGFVFTAIGINFVIGGSGGMPSSGYVGFDDMSVVSNSVPTISDKSGKGKNANVDGCVFSAPGIFFDGVNDKLDQTLSDPTGTFTICYKTLESGVFFENDLTTWASIKSTGGFSGTLLYLAAFSFDLSPIQRENLASLWSGAR